MTDRVGKVTFQPSFYDLDNWETLMAKVPQTNLMQAWAYGEARGASKNWRVDRGVFVDADENSIGLCQALVRRLPVFGDAFVWINRGPLLFGNGYDSLNTYEMMLAALAQHYVQERRLYMRIAPFQGVGAEELNWANEPVLYATQSLGWASSLLNLQTSEECLRAGLHGKWRNALVRAECSEIKIHHGREQGLFQKFLDGHRIHLQRRGDDAGIDPELLQAVQNALPDNQKLYTLIAEAENQFVGGMVMIVYDDTAEYLAGHNDTQGRRMNAGQLLLWTAIVEFHRQGLVQFDLGGMDEVLTPNGIFKFKQRIGEKPYRLPNELESAPKTLVGYVVRHQVRRARGKTG